MANLLYGYSFDDSTNKIEIKAFISKEVNRGYQEKFFLKEDRYHSRSVPKEYLNRVYRGTYYSSSNLALEEAKEALIKYYSEKLNSYLSQAEKHEICWVNWRLKSDNRK